MTSFPNGTPPYPANVTTIIVEPEVEVMASIRELRGLVHGANQFVVAKRAGIERTRLSFAECGYRSLEPGEERMVRSVLAELAREAYHAFLDRLREPQ